MKDGVTLVELLISVAVISILASITIPVTRTTTIRAREYELKRNLRILRGAIDEFKGDSNSVEEEEEKEKSKDEDGTGYPADLQTLVDERYLRRIPRDPFSREVSTGYNSNWVVIPSEKDVNDVWDIQSKSTQLSLGGEPYERW